MPGPNRTVAQFNRPSIFTLCSRSEETGYVPNPADATNRCGGNLLIAGNGLLTSSNFSEDELQFVDSIREQFVPCCRVPDRHHLAPDRHHLAEAAAGAVTLGQEVLKKIDAILNVQQRCSSKDGLMRLLRFLNLAIVVEENTEPAEKIQKILANLTALQTALDKRIRDITGLQGAHANIPQAVQAALDVLIISRLSTIEANDQISADQGRLLEQMEHVITAEQNVSAEANLLEKFLAFENAAYRHVILNTRTDLLDRLTATTFSEDHRKSSNVFDEIFHPHIYFSTRIKKILKKYDEYYKIAPNTPQHRSFNPAEQRKFLRLIAALETHDDERIAAVLTEDHADENERSLVHMLAALNPTPQALLFEDTPLLYLLAQGGYLTDVGCGEAIPFNKILVKDDGTGRFLGADEFPPEVLTQVFHLYQHTQLSRKKKSAVATSLLELIRNPRSAKAYKKAYQAALSENSRADASIAIILSSFDKLVQDQDGITDRDLIHFFHTLSPLCATFILDKSEKIDGILLILLPAEKVNLSTLFSQSDTFKRNLVKLYLDPRNPLDLAQQDEITVLLEELIAAYEQDSADYTHLLEEKYNQALQTNNQAQQKAMVLLAAQDFVSDWAHPPTAGRIAGLLTDIPAHLLLQILNNSNFQLQGKMLPTTSSGAPTNKDTLLFKLQDLGWPGNLLEALDVELKRKKGLIDFNIIEFCADRYWQFYWEDNGVPAVAKIKASPLYTEKEKQVYEALELDFQTRFNFFNAAYRNWFDGLTRIERTQALAAISRKLEAKKEAIDALPTTTAKQRETKKKEEKLYFEMLRGQSYIEARNWFSDKKESSFMPASPQTAWERGTLIDIQAIDNSINAVLNQLDQSLIDETSEEQQAALRLENIRASAESDTGEALSPRTCELVDAFTNALPDTLDAPMTPFMPGFNGMSGAIFSPVPKVNPASGKSACETIGEAITAIQTHLLATRSSKVRKYCTNYLYRRKTNLRELALSLLHDEAKLIFGKALMERRFIAFPNEVEVTVQTILSRYLASLKRNDEADWTNDGLFRQQQIMLTALRDTALEFKKPAPQRTPAILASLTSLLQVLALPAADDAAQTCSTALSAVLSGAETLNDLKNQLAIFHSPAPEAKATQEQLWQEGGKLKDGLLTRLGKFIASPSRWFKPGSWQALKVIRFNAAKLASISTMNSAYAVRALAEAPYCAVLMQDPVALFTVVETGLDKGANMLEPIITNSKLKVVVYNELEQLKTSDSQRYYVFALHHPNAVASLHDLTRGAMPSEDDIFSTAFDALYANNTLHAALIQDISTKQQVRDSLIVLIEKAVQDKNTQQLIKIFALLQKIGYARQQVQEVFEALETAANDEACAKMLRLSNPDFYATDKVSANEIAADNLISLFSYTDDEDEENKTLLGVLAEQYQQPLNDQFQTILAYATNVSYEKKCRLVFLAPSFVTLDTLNPDQYSGAIDLLANEHSDFFITQLCNDSAEATVIRKRLNQWLHSGVASQKTKHSILNTLITLVLANGGEVSQQMAEIIPQLAAQSTNMSGADQLCLHALTVLSDPNQTVANQKVAFNLLDSCQNTELPEEEKLAAGVKIAFYVIEQNNNNPFIPIDQKIQFVQQLKEEFGLADEGELDRCHSMAISATNADDDDDDERAAIRKKRKLAADVLSTCGSGLFAPPKRVEHSQKIPTQTAPSLLNVISAHINDQAAIAWLIALLQINNTSLSSRVEKARGLATQAEFARRPVLA